MKVTLIFMAQLRIAAGAPRVELEISEHATLQEAARKAAEQHGPALHEILFDNQGKPCAGILAFSGGEEVAWNTCVSQISPEFTLLSAMSGG